MITTCQRNVLFVDDEPDVLSGIRRLLREYRKEWNMEFVGSGQEALANLEKHHFDVVVSDMRMPGMNGVELMHEVQKKHPSVVRIVLSGDADRDSLISSVEATHQFLSKPCDPDLLKSTVARACALRDLLSSESLKSTISEMSSVPSLPSIYNEVSAAINDPESSIQSIGKLIAQDVAMTAQLLKLVNSAYFGLPKPVENASQAASVLGLDMIKSLVLALGVFSQFDKTSQVEFSLDIFQSHSQRVARVAKLIAESEGVDKQTASDSYLAGFLHDLGKLILIQNIPDVFGAVLKRVADESVSSWDAELDAFGATHGAVGAYLLGLWGLPESIVAATAFHNRPSELPVEQFSPLTAVHVANAFVHQSDSEDSDRLDMDHLAATGSQERLAHWREIYTTNEETSEEE